MIFDLAEQLTSDDYNKSAEVTSMLAKMMANDKQGIERQKTKIMTSSSSPETEVEIDGSDAAATDRSLRTIENCFRLLEGLHVRDMNETE